jgi:putative hydrolase of the HAD superfamily
VLKNKEKKLLVLLFDLGFTLINFEGDFKKAMKESYIALANSLVNSGVAVDPQQFAKKFFEVISEYYRNRAIDLIERPVEETLQKTLAAFSIDYLPETILQEAVKAMYTYTESWWKIEPDTHPTLKKLQKKGYRLGLISNASNSADLNRLIDHHKLRKYFEIVVISADEGIRKPDPRIFTKALMKMGVRSENALMVGDTLPADILGARLTGMRSVWVTRRADRSENNEVKELIKPDYAIPDVASLVPLLEQLEKSAS